MADEEIGGELADASSSRPTEGLTKTGGIQGAQMPVLPAEYPAMIVFPPGEDPRDGRLFMPPRLPREERSRLGLVLLPQTTSSTSGGGGSSGADEPGQPLEHVPTIPTKQDGLHYLGILAPLVNSLQEDFEEHLVYLDPYKEHADYQDLLNDASELDGCYSGFACPGWQDAPDFASALATYSTLDVTEQNKLKAAMLRKAAWEHYVNFRYMEQRMQERCGDYPPAGSKGEDFCMTRSEIKVENQIWRDWAAYRARFAAFSKWMQDTLVIKESDFVDVQRLDLDLQQFRQRFRKATGMSPRSPWPDTPPEEGAIHTLGVALKMIGGAALVLGGVYIGTRVFSNIGSRAPRGAGSDPKSLPAHKHEHEAPASAEPEPETAPRPTSSAGPASGTEEQGTGTAMEPAFA
jgi:hypothetical protein